MTIFLGGPATNDAEDKLLADLSGRVFRMESYGQPALVKLLNNALATYNLAATARVLNLAAEHGIPARDLFEVIGVPTGQSWMSDNFIDVQYDLLLKDVGLLRGKIGSLPAANLTTRLSKRSFMRVPDRQFCRAGTRGADAAGSAGLAFAPTALSARPGSLRSVVLPG